MPHPKYNTQKALYAFALGLRERSPWDYMSEQDMWVLCFPPPQGNLYAMVIGSMGESFGLVFYRGNRGLSALEKISGQVMDTGEAIQHINCLAVNFDFWKDLRPDYRKRLQRFGYTGDSGLWPSFLSHRPGKVPSHPDVAEADILVHAIKHSIPILDEMFKDNEFLSQGGEGTVLHVIVGEPLSKAKWLPLPKAVEVRHKAAPLDELGLKRLSCLELRPCSPWEVHVGNFGGGVWEGNEAFIPLIAIFADAETGFIAGNALSMDDEMPVELPRKLLDAMTKHKAKPESFHVEEEKIEAYIMALSEALGIPIVRKERLHKAREAITEMRKHMGEGRGKRGRKG